MIRAFVVVVFTVFPVLASAQCIGESFMTMLSAEDQAELEHMADETRFGSGLIWTAEKDGKTITFVGTLHLPDARHDFIIARLSPVLNVVDMLLVEATLEDQAAMQAYMGSHPEVMTITDGPTLPERLEPHLWAEIAEAAAARQIPGFMAAKMQPWFLSLSLAIPPCAMASIASGDPGLDVMVMQEAEKRGMPIAPLEDWQTLFALLSGGTFEEQMDALQLALINPEIQDALVTSMQDLYFLEETAKTWHLSRFIPPFLPADVAETFTQDFDQMEEQLLNDRNLAWIPVIEDAAARNIHIMVAFGAAHLIGDRGVLALMEDNGWVLTRLEF